MPIISPKIDITKIEITITGISIFAAFSSPFIPFCSIKTVIIAVIILASGKLVFKPIKAYNGLLLLSIPAYIAASTTKVPIKITKSATK